MLLLLIHLSRCPLDRYIRNEFFFITASNLLTSRPHFQSLARHILDIWICTRRTCLGRIPAQKEQRKEKRVSLETRKEEKEENQNQKKKENTEVNIQSEKFNSL